MHRTLIIAAVIALPLAASAQDQGAAVRKMMDAKQTVNGAAIPTGYQVPGPTHYTYDAFRGNVRVDPNSTANATEFWRRHGGSEGPGSGSAAASQ